ncbi:MAG: BRO family protein [Minisyncoccia bacterium]
MKKSTPKNIVLFEKSEVRRIWHKEEWYFSVMDVVAILSESTNPQVYWRVLKKRLIDEGSNETVTKCNALKMVAEDGKMRLTDVASLEVVFRIIQSIPSPKAEPFKQWLAKVGQERIEEIQDPERAMLRAKKIYEQKGYDDEWVAKRMRGINIRNTLTDEWKDRGVKEGIDFAILTNEIYKGTFEMNAKQIKYYKNLNNPDNLRDHMDEMELILTMLGEATTTRISQNKNSSGFGALQKDAKVGGKIAGNTRKQIENKTKQKVLRKENYLNNVQKKRLK